MVGGSCMNKMLKLYSSSFMYVLMGKTVPHLDISLQHPCHGDSWLPPQCPDCTLKGATLCQYNCSQWLDHCLLQNNLQPEMWLLQFKEYPYLCDDLAIRQRKSQNVGKKFLILTEIAASEPLSIDWSSGFLFSSLYSTSYLSKCYHHNVQCKQTKKLKQAKKTPLNCKFHLSFFYLC